MGGFVLEQDHNDTDTKVLQRISPTELWRLFQTGALPWSDIKINDQDIDDIAKPIGLPSYSPLHKFSGFQHKSSAELSKV
jgi:hypothetical protein